MTYRVTLSASARRALTDTLPEAVAAACFEFIRRPLAENPHRVGTPLRDRFEGRYSSRRGEFRVIYRIDDDRILVEVITTQHRRDVYR